MNIDLYKKCLKIPTVSPISFDDFSLYASFLARTNLEKSYSHSWTFLMQAGRWDSGQLGLKYCPDRYTLITIGFRADRFVIARPLGRNALKYLPALVHHLSEISNHVVYIKKLLDYEIGKLSRSKLISVKSVVDSDLWSAEEPKDDDTFPEVILDIHRSLDVSTPNPSLANFRSKVSRFKRFGIHIEFITDITLCLNELYHFLHHYRIGESPVGCAYTAMFQTIRIDPFQERVKWFVARIHKRVVGFFLAEATSNNTAALYAALSRGPGRASMPGLSEYLYRVMMQRLGREGFTYLNLGGSESETLDAYKRKFNPCELRRYQLVIASK